MKKRNVYERWSQEALDSPELGFIYFKKRKGSRSSSQKDLDALIVHVLKKDRKGVLLQSPLKFRVLSKLILVIHHPEKKIWMSTTGKVTWIKGHTSTVGYHMLGVDFYKKAIPKDISNQIETIQKAKISPADIDFLLTKDLFNEIPRESLCPLLNNLSFTQYKEGTRLISQGKDTDNLYIIRRGSCVVNLERNKNIQPLVRLSEGDIIGEMAILTGEKSSSHVDAETDMDLWALSKAKFNTISKEYPVLKEFMTEIVTHRLSTSKVTAWKTIGKYIIHDALGQGAWSIVYKGFHEKLNLPVAVKMLKHTMAMDPDFLEKFQNEAKIIARLNHPNIVKVYDIEERYRTVFIIMEFLEGLLLEYILKHMPKLQLTRALDIILQICSGLDYTHKKGIIHQDIKPGNIFIDPYNNVKIVDFGLAGPLGSTDDNLAGTLYYMPPEQILGEPVDERTDIYSLGITAYEMITGKRPFPEQNLSKLMDLHIKEDAPDPRMIVPGLPEEICKFLMKSVRKDPDRRYKSISEILDELAPLTEEMGLTCDPKLSEKRKMMSLFLFYQDEHQLALNRLIDTFNHDVARLGATLRVAQVEDI
jgi:tRNA A-37 threonylcarbamoyl transferase component Bud32/Tfp pilus assembly protein PilZ